MRQAGVYACLIIRALLLEKELQRKLNVSRRLRSLNNAGSGLIHSGVGNGKVDAVEGVQEISAELHPEPLRDLDILLQAEIPVVVAGTTQTTELRCASPETACCVGIVAGIKPEEASTGPCWGWAPTINLVGSVAVRSVASGTRSGLVRVVGIKGQGEAAVESHDWTNRPTARDGVLSLVHATAELLALTNRYVVDGVGSEVVGFIVITRGPLRRGIVNVLPIRGSGGGSSGTGPSTVVTGVVGHAFGEGVGNLSLQSVTERFLENGL